MPPRYEPKLVTTLREGYSLEQLGRDVVAGVIVGVVALPLAIAFGIASGVKPEQGLYTAIVAGFLISALGGSRVQIGGPTGAFVVIVYRIVQEHGYDGLAVATLMAGVILIAMGVARLGSVIKYIPYPLTVGFTAGIALLIAVSQVRDLLGLRMQSPPPDFLAELAAYAEHLGSWNPAGAAIGLGTIALLVFWPRLSPRVPGPLVALVVATTVVHGLGLPVETIGDRFGDVPSTLPVPALPAFELGMLRSLVPSAMAIALLAAIESLLSAVVADGMIGARHRSNVELIAQGVANIASPLFGGIPATGAIARTATNVRSGGRTPVAGIVHAVTLLLIVIFFASQARLIPLAALAGILMMVAYNMSEWRVFVHLLRSPRSDILVMTVTFALTVLVDLTVALQAGMVLAALLFMRRMAELSQARYVTRRDSSAVPGEEDPNAIELKDVPDGVEVFEVQGAFFFGATSKFKDAIGLIDRPPRVLVLRLRDVPTIDATALRAIEDLVAKTERDGTVLVLSGAAGQPLSVLERAGLVDRIRRANVCPDIDAALARARELIAAAGLDAAKP
ncbi:MAG: sulfate permease [Myxococcales bacterium]|nr:MAG: sulfate permease [Myxococcales bacterium]